MLKTVTRSYLINLFGLFIASQYIGGFHLAEGIKSLLFVGAGFTALHLIIKPVFSIFLGVLNFLTLGIIGLIIDAVILYALTLYFPQVSIMSWDFTGLVVNGFVVPPYLFNVIETTILSAFIINFIRSILTALV